MSAGGRFRVAEHHANFHPDLIDKNHGRLRFAHNAGELPEGLTHQSRVQPHVRIAHFAFDLRSRRKRGHRVHDNDVNGVASHECIYYVQGLFARIWLGNEQVIKFYTDAFRIIRVERVFGVNECRCPAAFLHFGDHMHGESRFAGRFWSKNFYHSPFGYSPNTQSQVQGDRTRRCTLHVHSAGVFEFHNRTVAKFLPDLLHGSFEGLMLGINFGFSSCFGHINKLYTRGMPG